MKTLMVTEECQLRRCEAVIEKGMSTFVEVGQALAEIRDKRLYRDSHKTFELYVKERWNKGRTWAQQVITAAATVENVRNCEQNPPTNEAQARELSKAPPEKQAEVWEEAAKDGKPTAAKVEQAVKKISGGVTFDVDELEEDDALPDLAELAAPYKQAGRDIDRIRRDFTTLAEDPLTGGHLADKITRITTSCRELKATIQQMTPTQLCGKCGGKACKWCASTGFWTKATVESLRQ